jgi:hypothetical protein
MTIRKPFLLAMCIAAVCVRLTAAWGQNDPERVAAREVVLPKIAGPILVTSDSYPFMSADQAVEPFDLNKVGYVDDLYFFG